MAVSIAIFGACLIATAYGFALAGAGFAAIAALGRVVRGPTFPIDISSAFCVGLGLYGGIWILLGLAGWLRLPAVAALLVAGFAYGIWSVSWRNLRWDYDLRRPSGLLLSVFFLALLAILGFASLRPPFGDSAAFYFAWPKVIAASGVIKVLPGGYEDFCSIWMLAEAHFAALMLLGGEHAAKFFVWVSLLAGVRAMWLLAAECGCGSRGRLLAVLALATSTAVINVTVDGKSDLIAVAPALLSVIWSLRLGLDRRATIFTGLLAGTAVGAKLSYIIPLGASLASLILVAALVVARPGERLRRMARWCLMIALAAVVVSIPQVIKNDVLFSNPLLPLVGSGMGREVWFADQTTLRILLSLPLSLTFGTYWAQYGTLSPLVLGGLGLLIASGWWRNMTPLLYRITLAGVVAIAAWFIVLPSQIAPRYFLAPLLLTAIPAAWALERAWRRAGLLLPFGVVAFALAAIGIVMSETILVHAKAARQYAIAEVNGGDVCGGDSYCDILEVVNREVKPGERLLLLAYYRYHLRPDILQCVVPKPEALTVAADAVQRLGTDYVLVDRTGYYRPDFPVDEAAFNLIYDTPKFRLYRARPELKIGIRRPRCIEERPGYWKAS